MSQEPTQSPSVDAKGGEDSGQSDKGNADASTDVVSRAELDRVVAERQELKSTVRDLTTRLESIESEKNQANLDKARKDKDIESLEARINEGWEKKYNTLKAQDDEKAKTIRKYTVENKFRALLKEQNVHDENQIMAMLGNRLDSQKDGSGNDTLIVRDGEIIHTDVKGFLDDFFKKNPNLVKSPRQQGSGFPQPGNINNASSGEIKFPANYGSMSVQQKTEFLKTLPPEQQEKLAREATITGG